MLPKINKEFEYISDIIKTFPTEQSCTNHLEQLRWDYLVVSPFDASSKVYKCPNNNYKCKNTGKYFNVKTGTLFHNSKVTLQKWFVAIWLVTEHKNISSVALGKELNITQKTAWYIIQRIKSYYHLDIEKHLRSKIDISTPNKVVFEVSKNKMELFDWLTLYQLKK